MSGKEKKTTGRKRGREGGGGGSVKAKRAVTKKVKTSSISGVSAVRQLYPRPGKEPPAAIDYMTFAPREIPPNWGSKASATAAARVQQTLARLMGIITLEFIHVSSDTAAALSAPFEILEPYREEFQCSVDGEYNSDGSFGEDQIPLTRLVEGVSDSLLLTAPGSITPKLLQHLYALQQPGTSNWNIPFIRVFSRHKYTRKSRALTVEYYVYFTRLIFELISDEAIKVLMENIKVSFNIEPCTKRLPTHSMFHKENAEMLQIRSFRFSLPGLLKHVESTGYGFDINGQSKFVCPRGLNVNLYDFQKSTYLWMLDQESDERGLNGRFWEEWHLKDGGGPLYYFPLGGEFRFNKPPMARGGLLCEEMGLGKTIEVLALVLGNPASQHSMQPNFLNHISSVATPSEAKNIMDKLPSRATLIVVPPNLSPQWWEEIQKRTTCGCDREKGEITALNLTPVCSSKKDFVASCDVREIVFDDNDNIIDRKPWGQFTHGSEVEIRSLPLSTNDVVLRGYIPVGGATKQFKLDDIYRYSYESWTVNSHHFKGENASHQLDCIEIILELEDIAVNVDIVLTTYNGLKNKRFNKLFKNLIWHRIVLDECQEIKIATNDIAKLCANLTSERRWMVSGTPLCTTVNDLHGELNFLKVWPFCLPNSEDGFWDLLVHGPWKRRDETALSMLYALLDVVMMRHSKSQRYVTNDAPLVMLPNRTVEWRGFDQQEPKHARMYSSALSGNIDNAKYAYEYIECFAADAVERFLSRNELSGTSSHHQWMSTPHAKQLKGIYSILSRCLTHPRAVSLQHLDHLKRMLGDVTGIIQYMKKDEGGVPLLSPEDILSLVQGTDMGPEGGITGSNRESSRIQVSVAAHEIEQRQRDTLMTMSVAELTLQLEEFELPRPITWINLPFRGSINRNSHTVNLYHPTSKENAGKLNDDNPTTVTARRSLHKELRIGDKIRLHSAKSADTEGIVSRVIDRFSDPHHNWKEGYDQKQGIDQDLLVEGEIELSNKWVHENKTMVHMFKRSFSSRKANYVDLLVANAQAMNFRELYAHNQSTSDNSMLHSGGFSTIYKLMAGLTPKCPLCLDECTRPTVTSCVHVYCFDCIASVISRESNCNTSAKCPICRRKVSYNTLMEVKDSGAQQDCGEKLGCNVADDDESTESLLSSNILVRKERFVGSSSSGHKAPRPTKSSTSSTTPIYCGGNKTENQVSSEGDAIVFSVPPLNISSTAPITQSIEKLENETVGRLRYSGKQFERQVHLPSITPYALSVFQNRLRGIDDLSPRIKAVLDDIRQVQKDDPFAKFVIFTQYKESLKVCFEILNNKGMTEGFDTHQPLQCVCLDDNGLTKFYTEPKCNILFLTLGAAATGLTLTMAKTLYILEPSPSAVDEAQAISRIHRIGQTAQNVRCVIFFARNTCEERLLALRQKNHVLSEVLSSGNQHVMEDSIVEVSSGNSRRKVKKGRRISPSDSPSATMKTDGDRFFSGNNLKCLLGAGSDRHDPVMSDADIDVEEEDIYG